MPLLITYTLASNLNQLSNAVWIVFTESISRSAFQTLVSVLQLPNGPKIAEVSLSMPIFLMYLGASYWQ